MPIKDNAKKALRQSIVCARRNKVAKDEIHSLRVKLRKAITSGKTAEAAELLKTVTKKVDKAATKKIIKKNTAARIKSRTALKVNAIGKAPKAEKPAKKAKA